MNICPKKEKRNIYNIFKEYSCYECKYRTRDEIIKIGYKTIHIYYLSKCDINYYKGLDIRRSKILFKDIILDSFNKDSNNIFLWLDNEDDFSNYFDLFNALIIADYNIHIII